MTYVLDDEVAALGDIFGPLNSQSEAIQSMEMNQEIRKTHPFGPPLHHLEGELETGYRYVLNS